MSRTAVFARVRRTFYKANTQNSAAPGSNFVAWFNGGEILSKPWCRIAAPCLLTPGPAAFTLQAIGG
jgi:hypothetical protein